MSNTFVCIMGMGTVFIGLICIILICKLMSLVMKGFSQTEKKPEAVAAVSAPAPVAQNTALPIQDKQAIIAGACAVIAEELGTDVKNIRVLSFKRV